MSTLREIKTALMNVVRRPAARCAILCSDGFLESSLMGTRDGYLNLAISLINFVDDCDHQTENSDIDRIEEEHAYWGDSLKRALHQLPGCHTYIVGSYLFDDHQSLIEAIEREVDSTLGDRSKLRHDPSFREPPVLE